ncbi:MAG: cation-translocating P-type ATPase [Clostridium sp.]
MLENKKIEKVYEELNCNGTIGLGEEDASERLRHYGKNELEEPKKKILLKRIGEQLCDSLIFVLFAAAAVSLMLHEYSDAVIILIVVSLNAVVGIIQEGKAEKALEALKRMTMPEAVVVREGKPRICTAKELVPGDLVLLDAGRRVPADLRLVQSINLKIEESALTGESEPVFKNTSSVSGANMAFMTSYVTAGRGSGIVVATGMNTEIGKIAGMIHEAEDEETPLQKRLSDLGKVLSLTAVILCAALFALAVIQKRDVMEMLITAISLAVAAVPEGLPAVVTIVLALGVTRMAKVGTIVRRLPSVETLGSVSVVCTDKTGTLTQNEMTVTACYVDGILEEVRGGEAHRGEEHRGGKTRKRLVECFALCNDASITTGDPTEIALVKFAVSEQMEKSTAEKNKPRVAEIPFDSERKMMTTLNKEEKNHISYTKGAPDRVLRQCNFIMKNGRVVPMSSQDRRQIQAAVTEMSGHALRVLAAAMAEGVSKPVEKNLVFLGMAGMMDPPRPEAGAAVDAFKKASVRTVMITGDYIDTAFAVAKKLGIAGRKTQCLSGEELERMEDSELSRRVQDTNVFARVSPEHKVRIVKALKSVGNIVAMTGDGVNDAPSLKSADIGIAMGLTGTDVAKQAADMILTDDNFATIERAIEEGRGLYENIKKSVIFLLSSNFGEIVTMFAAIAIRIPAPLKPSHILWINLITDSLPALALGVDKNDGAVLMNRPPRKWNESLFSDRGMAFTLFYGCLISTISLVAFLKIPCEMLIHSGMGVSIAGIIAILEDAAALNRAQTYAFTVLGMSQLFHAIGMRDVRKSVFASNFFSNPLMIGAFMGGILLQLAVTEIPYFVIAFNTTLLSLHEWGFLLCLASLPLVMHEILVIFKKKRYKRKALI